MTRFLYAASVAMTIAIFGACGQQPTLPNGALDPIKIGMVTSLSGTLGEQGTEWANAAKLAAYEINAAGGLLDGRRVDVIVADDETDATVARREAERLVEEEGVIAIVGAAASEASIQIAQKVAGPREIPQVSISASPLLNAGEGNDDSDPYFFRTVARDDAQGRTIGGVAGGQWFDVDAFNVKCASLAIVHLSGDYGEPIAQAVAERYTKLEAVHLGSIVRTVSVTDGLPSYRDKLIDVIRDDPECIAIIAYAESGGRIIREWYENSGNENVIWIGSDGLRSTGLRLEAGDVIEPPDFETFRVIGVSVQPTPPGIEGTLFRNSYFTMYGQEPIVYCLSHYDAMALLLLAIDSAGNTTGQTIANHLKKVSQLETDPEDPEAFIQRTGPTELGRALEAIDEGRDIDYNSPLGTLDFDVRGDVTTNFEVWDYRDGEFRALDTIPYRDVD